MNEQKEFEEKAKTGFKTQEGFFPAGSAEQSTPSTKQNNFFGTQNRPNTQGGGEDSKFRKLNGVQGDIINDPSNVCHDLLCGVHFKVPSLCLFKRVEVCVSVSFAVVKFVQSYNHE